MGIAGVGIDVWYAEVIDVRINSATLMEWGRFRPRAGPLFPSDWVIAG